MARDRRSRHSLMTSESSSGGLAEGSGAGEKGRAFEPVIL